MATGFKVVLYFLFFFFLEILDLNIYQTLFGKYFIKISDVIDAFIA